MKTRKERSVRIFDSDDRSSAMLSAGYAWEEEEGEEGAVGASNLPGIRLAWMENWALVAGRMRFETV